MCASTHRERLAWDEPLHELGREADSKRGKNMSHQHTAEAAAAELYSLEHHFSIGWALAGLLGAGNIGATVLMLLAQA
jgi:hypothetical protein